MYNKLLVSILMLFSATTFAYDLSIIVKNDTHDNCELIDTHSVKGSDPFTVIKTTLLSSESTEIGVTEYLRGYVPSRGGIDYVLSYRCGNAQVGYKKITFSSRQSSHFLYARPYGEIQSDLTDQGITAIIEDTTASVADTTGGNTTGVIVWSIRM